MRIVITSESDNLPVCYDEVCRLEVDESGILHGNFTKVIGETENFGNYDFGKHGVRV